MRGIDEYKNDKNNLTLQNIISQSLWYSRCCVTSVSLMSGFGIRIEDSRTAVQNCIKVLKSPDDRRIIPDDIVMLRAIYKKGDPHYSSEPDDSSRDSKNHIWDESSFKKIIAPTSQAYLILNEVMLAKYLYNCTRAEQDDGKNADRLKALSLLLINSATTQGEFMSGSLRNSEGLFVSKLDKSENPFISLELEDAGDEPLVVDQASAMKAFSALSDTLNDDRYPIFKDEKNAPVFKKYGEEICLMLEDSTDDVFGSKAKDLSGIISSCVQHYRLDPSDKLLKFIASLSLELESRIDMSGNIARLPDSDTLTSSSSCFYIIKSLIESYRITGIEKLLDTSTLLYKRLDLLWDPKSNLYSLEAEDKYKYTLRDIGSIIAGLNAVRLFGDISLREQAAERLAAFFNSAVNSSGIVQSCMPPPNRDEYEGQLNCIRNNTKEVVAEDFASPGIPRFPEGKIAPVFAKKFTYRPKKRKYSINSSTFYSDYALFTASEMLCMSFPEVECFYSREDCTGV